MQKLTITPPKINFLFLLWIGLVLFGGYKEFQRLSYSRPDRRPAPHLREIVASADKIHVYYLHPSKLKMTGIMMDIVPVKSEGNDEIAIPHVLVDPDLFGETKAEACSEALADATFDYQVEVRYKGMDVERDIPGTFVFNSHTGRLFSLSRPAECGRVSPAFQRYINDNWEKSRKREVAVKHELAQQKAVADRNRQSRKYRAHYPAFSQEGEAIYMGEGRVKVLGEPVHVNRP